MPLVLSTAAVRAHTVWGMWRGWQRDLCQHLQHMGSKTLQLAHRRRCSNSFSIKLSCAMWTRVLGSTYVQNILATAHNETIEADFFIKPVKVSHTHDISILTRWKCWSRAHCDDGNSFIFQLSNSWCWPDCLNVYYWWLM